VLGRRDSFQRRADFPFQPRDGLLAELRAVLWRQGRQSLNGGVFPLVDSGKGFIER
jgi:hypothetical protein